LKITSNSSKTDNRQEGKPLNFQALFLEGNEHLSKLNEISSKLTKYTEFPEFLTLIKPMEMKINHYLENLNTVNDNFIINLQKGNEENDQLCLEYISESEKLINDSYFLINNSFNENIMKAIDRSHVENESIFKETKCILGLLFNLKSILENICKEDYICSLVLKKKVENKLLSIKILITNLDGLFLAISNCSFFNISNINSIMNCNLQVNNKVNELKKTEKLERIVGHIKEIESFLMKNQKEIIEKVNKNIKERINIEVKFYNYFLFMDKINIKVAKIFEIFKLNEFSLLLFDNAYIEQISELCLLFNEIDNNSQQIVSLNYDQKFVLQKIEDNIKQWKDNIQNHLYFDEKSIQILKNKLIVISNMKNEENDILREMNGIFALCDKTPRKKKKDSLEKETLIERFINQANAFSELTSETQIAKNYIFGYRQRVIVFFNFIYFLNFF